MTYTLSKNAKKPTKQTAYETVLKLKAGCQIPQNDIDELLLYFAPPIPKVAKTAEQWLSQAVGVKDIRPMLQYIYVENGIAVATDGQRMHVVYDVEYDDGFYDPNTWLKTERDPGRFPDWRRVIDGIKPFHKTTLDDLSKSMSTDRKPITVYVTGDKVGVNERYINQALLGDTKRTFEYDAHHCKGDNQFGKWVVSNMRL